MGDKKELGWNLHSWEGTVKRKGSLNSENFLCWLGDQLGEKGSFRGSEESPGASLWLAKLEYTSTDSPGHLTAVPNPACMLVCQGGFSRENGGENGLGAQRQLDGSGAVCR